MPIYEYRCQQCNQQLEVLQKLSDKPLSLCPECQQNTLNRVVSAPAFKLTGTGWYETDFKDKKSKTETKQPETKPKKDPKD